MPGKAPQADLRIIEISCFVAAPPGGMTLTQLGADVIRADPTRRAILERLRAGEATLGELAEPFDMSLQAVALHLKVLERSGLITRGRVAQTRPARIAPGPLDNAAKWLLRYREFWQGSFELVVCEVDLRVGGSYRFVHRAPDGSQHAFYGQYREIERPSRLVSTFTYEAAPETEVLDEVTFEENGGTTLVTERSIFPTFEARELYTAAGAERGLAECHERLDELLTPLASQPREGQRQ
jgi:uncharacterized protein YndB with AHSA1/START domain